MSTPRTLVPDPAEREPFERERNLAVLLICLTLGGAATVMGFGSSMDGEPGPVGLVAGVNAFVFVGLALRYVIVLWLRGHPRLSGMRSDNDRCSVGSFAYGLSRTDLLHMGPMFSMWPLLTRRGAHLWTRHIVVLSLLMVAPTVLWGLGAMQLAERIDLHRDAAGPLGLLSIAFVGAALLIFAARNSKRPNDPAQQRLSDVLFEVAVRLAVHDPQQRLRWQVTSRRGNSHVVVTGALGWRIEAKTSPGTEEWMVTLGEETQTIASGPIGDSDPQTLAASIAAALDRVGVGDVWRAERSSRPATGTNLRTIEPTEISSLGDLQRRFLATDAALVDPRTHEKSVWTLAAASVGMAIATLLLVQLLDVTPMWACAPLALLGAVVAGNVDVRQWPTRFRSTSVGKKHTVSLLGDELRIDTERVPLSRPFTATFGHDPGRGLHVDLVASGGQQRVRFTVQADCSSLELPILATTAPILPAAWTAETLWPELRARAEAQGLSWPYEFTR